MDYAKALRIARALTLVGQTTLAERCDVNPSYISLLETKRRNPSAPMMAKLACGLGISTPLFHLLAMEAPDLASATPATRNAYGLMLLDFVLNPKGEKADGE